MLVLWGHLPAFLHAATLKDGVSPVSCCVTEYALYTVRMAGILAAPGGPVRALSTMTQPLARSNLTWDEHAMHTKPDEPHAKSSRGPLPANCET
eukprot:1853627-Amphidinium_carterae.1